jgi:hypothetical protein
MSRVLAVVLSTLVLVLSACGLDAIAEDSDVASEFHQRTQDGQVVTCFYYRGLSCNWEDAVPE